MDGRPHEIEAIYVHFDGYPQAVGRYLLRYWDSEPRVKKLISQGNRSSLGADPDSGRLANMIIAYNDKPQSSFYEEDARTYQNEDDWFSRHPDVSYFYLWGNNGWMMQESTDRDAWVKLESIIILDDYDESNFTELEEKRDYNSVFCNAASAVMKITEWTSGRIGYIDARKAITEFIKSADAVFIAIGDNDAQIQDT
jgi:hypothetical protein